MGELNLLERQYHNDPAFHNFVNVMVDCIECMALTPLEVRNAAMFAAMIFERRYPPMAVQRTGVASFNDGSRLENFNILNVYDQEWFKQRRRNREMLRSISEKESHAKPR